MPNPPPLPTYPSLTHAMTWLPITQGRKRCNQGAAPKPKHTSKSSLVIDNTHTQPQAIPHVSMLMMPNSCWSRLHNPHAVCDTDWVLYPSTPDGDGQYGTEYPVQSTPCISSPALLDSMSLYPNMRSLFLVGGRQLTSKLLLVAPPASTSSSLSTCVSTRHSTPQHTATQPSCPSIQSALAPDFAAQGCQPDCPATGRSLGAPIVLSTPSVC